MLAKRLFILIAAVAILFLQVQSCMSDPMSNQQDMQCCKSMHCTTMSKTQGCCKDMVSPNSPNLLPSQQHSLQVPTVAAVEYLQMPGVVRRTESLNLDSLDTTQHSPPELYTLHASLLI